MQKLFPFSSALLVLSAGWVVGCGGGAASDEAGPAVNSAGSRPARPNVLIILADDLRYDGLSATGNPWIQTPTLDRIAREGIQFERCYVTTSRCCPSRASFLTGRYAHVHGVVTNKPKHDFQKRFPTYADELQAAGYHTGYIGKWHILARDQEPAPRPGFDRWVSYEGPGSHFDQVFNVDGETVPSKGFQADRLGDYATEFLEQHAEHARDQPFLLTVAFKNPHVPMTPPPRHRGLLDDAAIELPASAYDPVDSLPFFYRRLRRNTERNHAIETVEGYVEDTRRYWELVLSIDDNVARILDVLSLEGELDHTVVIITADNGQLLGEHGIQQKGISYEPSIRIPFALRYPPLTAGGAVTKSIALNVDLFPTLMDLCSIEDAPASDGMSLVPVLEHPETIARSRFLYVGPQWNNGVMDERAVIDGDLKLIRFVADDGAQDVLFDMAKDPDERVDVIDEPSYAEDIRRMRAFMDAESRRLGL